MLENKTDDELYKKYLLGDKEAFEKLYDRYKNKITYFIYNIVKDIEASKDITQDVFMYIMKNEIKERYSFKNHIYLIAKSRAINYVNTVNRRTAINEKYNSKIEQINENLLDDIIEAETKKQVISIIDLLEDKYKNVLYLIYLENMSYKEVAEIIEESYANTKNIIHRGKMKLYKILVKKGFGEMNKKLKVFVILLLTAICIVGVVYGATVIYKKVMTSHKVVSKQQ